MAIFSALMVIASRNTVNSVFFLILDFISVGCLFIMVGAEFIGMILLIVYVGAVAVSLLSVVFVLRLGGECVCDGVVPLLPGAAGVHAVAPAVRPVRPHGRDGLDTRVGGTCGERSVSSSWARVQNLVMP